MNASILSFIIFLLLIFALLLFLAIIIDLIDKFKFRSEKRETFIPLEKRNEIDNILDVLNSIILSPKKIGDVIAICPEDAISQVTKPEFYLNVSESKCLGKSCLKCFTVIENSYKSKQT